MTDSDKTIVLDSTPPAAEPKICPACGAALEYDREKTDMLRCPVCNFTRHCPTVIEPGSIVGDKYRVLNYLNSGGVGDLFLCHPLNDASERYVMKILRPSDGISRRRFRREAKILASIEKTDRIVKLIDIWESGNDIFIIMEYIRGKNLKQLQNEYVFDEHATLEIACETAKVLRYIWETYSIIHRDIKPENIMLDENFCLKLLDFGLSKQCGDTNCTDLTMPHLGLGTPGYMSPEQFKDSRSVDFRADIFSLGATMFFLLTGKRPFCGSNAMEIYQDTLTHTPPDAIRFEGKCSPECIDIIRRMMRAKPAERYSGYDELLADINSLLN